MSEGRQQPGRDDRAPSSRSALSVLADGELRYSTVWEDHLLLESGLQTVAGSNMLMIASAGCNVLNLLLQEPRRIVAIDANPAQIALTELKLAAFRKLVHGEILALLGHRKMSAERRLGLYDSLRPSLTPATQTWWDGNQAALGAGAAGSGRLDRFIADFRQQHVAGTAEEGAVTDLFTAANSAAQRRAVDALFTPRFETAFREYFTRDALAARGRDESQMRFVAAVDVPEWFLSRLRWACTELPIAGNFYLSRFLRGDEGAAEEWLPPYLRAESHERLRSLTNRVDLVVGSLEEYLARRDITLDHAALSDIFEYMSPAESDRMFELLRRALRRGGRIAYWNLLVPRSSPDGLRDRLRPLDAVSNALWERDRAWFYRAFHVEEAVG